MRAATLHDIPSVGLMRSLYPSAGRHRICNIRACCAPAYRATGEWRGLDPETSSEAVQKEMYTSWALSIFSGLLIIAFFTGYVLQAQKN